jgi:hypothetical protein
MDQQHSTYVTNLSTEVTKFARSAVGVMLTTGTIAPIPIPQQFVGAPQLVGVKVFVCHDGTRVCGGRETHRM